MSDIKINELKLENITYKPLTAEDVNKQKKNKIFTTFISYDNDKFLLDCKDLPLVTYAGIPKYDEGIHDGPNHESLYKISINLDETNKNLKLLKEQLEKIDELTKKKKDDIFIGLKKEQKDKLIYSPIIKIPKDKEEDGTAKSYTLYNKINLKVPIIKENGNCKIDNNKFLVFKYIKQTKKSKKINGINTIDDLRKIVKRNAIIRPLINFQKVWANKPSGNAPGWGLTLQCVQLLIIDEGKNNLEMRYGFSDCELEDGTINVENNTSETSSETSTQNKKKESKKSNKSDEDEVDAVDDSNEEINEDDEDDVKPSEQEEQEEEEQEEQEKQKEPEPKEQKQPNKVSVKTTKSSKAKKVIKKKPLPKEEIEDEDDAESDEEGDI